MTKEIAMTYQELAARLGIKLESARKTVQRKKWKRISSPNGIATVFVPKSYLDDMVGEAILSGPDVVRGTGETGSSAAVEFLEQMLAEQGEAIGPVLRAAFLKLDRGVVKRLVLAVAGTGAV